jgi:hypothetical protein
METAITWGDSPFGFSARTEMERAIMTAHHRERSMRKAMVDKIQSQVSDKNSKKGSGAPTHDPHAGFFGGID